ncbi:MAG: FtsX-like permease family protein [Microbacterium sp.]|uniref:ABC transporter permease n=1 Tax=Microbacterium sp. TaxID=51671 RepID=UPI0026298EB7|nr:ABC transporter permease [Microbacterium sp.]MCX6501747.1 FtsX-like permease family protein [Microbacterium sp.]
MNAADLVATGVSNTLRARARTTLTVLAIFVGAFTLTLTSGLGTGINRYIDDTVSALGASDVITVTKVSDVDAGATASGPREYDPDAVVTGQGLARNAVTLMTASDLDDIGAIDGVLDVAPVTSVQLDYVQYAEGAPYVAGLTALVAGQTVQLAAGTAPDVDAAELEVTIPVSYVEPLGFDDADEAIGETLDLTLTDAAFTAHTVPAVIVAVAEEGLTGPGGSSLIANTALQDELATLQSAGLPADQLDRWSSATAWFDPGLTTTQIDNLKARLADAGYTGTTTADQLGAFTTVIDTIVLVLNVFAAIALLAAGFGIVNTLLMSVQERTREIGLMKALGMSSARVFTLFSIEAVFIGFLGSAIGVAAAMVVGTAASSILAGALLSALPGLTIIAFDPVTIALTILLIMFVAFLAGTLPAARAAGKDPVEALRYE